MNIHITIDAESPALARQAMQDLLGSTSVSSRVDEYIAAGQADEAYTPAEQAARTIPVPDTSAPARERGKPSAGNARRTKAEIAEDEAADKADAAVKKAGEETGGIVADKVVDRDITNRPEDRGTDADAAQDAEDEAAETAGGETKLTHDDVRAALGKYVKAFGMAAAQEDGPVLIQRVLGDETKSKISDLPDDQDILAKAVAGVEEMIAKNPFKRTADL